MIQTVYTSKFSIFSTVSKCEPKTTERSFQNNQNIANNGLIGAENRMAKIEERLLAVESTTINSYSDSSIAEDAVRNYQKQMLAKLLSVREKVSEEVGDYANIKEERDCLLNENTKLKKEAERQNYRIKHLIKALSAEEEKQS